MRSMSKNPQTPSRNWLPYLEAVIIVLFIALVGLFTHKGETQSKTPPMSRAREFIGQADRDFAKQDLGKAALAYWEAIRIIESAARDGNALDVELEKNLLHANLRVAEIYQHSSWIKDARHRLELAAQIQPDHADVRLLRGKLARDDGDRLSAVNEFLAVIEQHPTHAEAHYRLGLLYRGAKQFEDAITHYKIAIDNDAELVELPFESYPIGLQARLQLARTYRRMLQDYQLIDREVSAEEIDKIGRMEEDAVSILEEAVDKRANFADAKNDLINLLAARALIIEREADTRPYDEALKVYERIVELDPTMADIWKKMGEIYAHFLDDKHAALKAFKQAYELDSDLIILAEIEDLEADLANNDDR